MKSSKELKAIADQVNQNRPEFLSKEAESTIRSITEGLDRSANKGKYQRVEHVRTEEIVFLQPYFEILKSKGYVVTKSQNFDPSINTITISWE